MRQLSNRCTLPFIGASTAVAVLQDGDARTSLSAPVNYDPTSVIHISGWALRGTAMQAPTCSAQHHRDLRMSIFATAVVGTTAALSAPGLIACASIFGSPDNTAFQHTDSNKAATGE